MCVIIIKEKKDKINIDILRASSRINPDGLGVVWLDDYSVEYFKSTSYKVLYTQRPFIAHFRYATKGKVCRENTHPFVCGENCDELLMMNGTIKDFGDPDVCDTKVLAEILGNNPRHIWKPMLEQHLCRFATINTRKKTYEIYNNTLWTEYDGVLYSKNNVLELNYVAVYGTLKKDYSNYLYYLSDSKYLGSGLTKNKYPLVIKGLPYLINKKGIGHNVCVDVFRVTDETLMRLDKLEGHPNWYERKKIDINLNGYNAKCWIYFNKSNSHEGEFLHKTYLQNHVEYHLPMYTKPNPHKRILSRECDSCLEWYDLDDERDSIHCPQCEAWITEFYESI
jgi:gamma-glutamylcyclotransferase (GGCT)/AIG2-like uncharacterized protein YtfP